MFDESDEACSISTSWQRSCQTDAETGQLRCETIKRILKQCPGKPPEESVERQTGDDDSIFAGSAPPRFGSLFGGFGGSGGSGGGGGWPTAPPPSGGRDIESEIFGSFRVLESMMGAMQGLLQGGAWPPHPHARNDPSRDGWQQQPPPQWRLPQPPPPPPRVPVRVDEI